MVMVFDAQFAVTPPGNPVAVPMPVAPVVVWVTGVKAVLMHKVGVDDGGVTVLMTAVNSAVPFICRSPASFVAVTV